MTESGSTSAERVRRVLVVAYVFPPAGGAGVQRVARFVKYLPQSGWDCSVLTVSNPSVPVFDASLTGDIPESTVIRKARTYEPGYAFKNAVSAGAEAGSSRMSRFSVRSSVKKLIRSAGNVLLQPDAQILWYPQALKQGLQLLKELHHDAIFVTAPPFSSFVVASELSRRSGLPLIIDYRDEWGISNQYQENRQKSRISHWLQSRMQKRVLRQARAVVATTRRSAESIAELVQKSGSKANVSPVYNGFDREDLTQLKPAAPRTDGTLRLAYVGTLWNLTSVEPVVAALCRVARERPELAARIEFTVAGRRTAEQDAILDRLNETPCELIREGYVDHARAMQIMSDADALCLLLSDVPEAERVVPAKTFEYLALERSILAVVPPGEVSEILSGCEHATIHSPADVVGIAAALTARLERAECSGFEPVVADSGYVERFERRALAEQLADVLNRATGLSGEGEQVGYFPMNSHAIGSCNS